MRIRKVYGKRPTAQQELADQVFAQSSSPIKPDLQKVEEPSIHVDSPSRNTRGALERSKRATTSPDRPYRGSKLVDDIVEGLESLSLGLEETTTGTERLPKTPVSTPLPPSSRQAFQVRDANAEVKPRRRPRKKDNGLDITCKVSYADTCSIEEETRLVETKHIFDPPKDDASSPTLQEKRARFRRSARAGIRSVADAEDRYSEFARPLLSLCGDRQGQQDVGLFQAWSDSLAQYLDIAKIAEASYGEVYRLSLRDSHTTLTRSDESVLKIIALKPPPSDLVPTAREATKLAAMSDIVDVTNECRVLRHMSPIPGFTNFRDVRVLQGRLPTQFVAAWKRYNKDVKKSLFPDPSRKASYSEEQLWAVVEMQDAGTDVETLVEKGLQVGIFAAWDIFWGVAGAVAKGEEWADFEHRDLHMGNICVRPSSLSAGLDSCTNATNFLDPPQSSLVTSRTLNYTKVETTLIDYTLSRAYIPSTTHPGNSQLAAECEDQNTAFFDLSKDAAIFAGDSAEEYQYDIYRFMRSVVLYADPAARDPSLATTKKGKKNRKKGDAQIRDESGMWRESHKLTNLVWLHFVLFKLLEAVSNAVERVEGAGDDGEEEAELLGRELRRRMNKLSGMLAIDKLGGSKLRTAGELVLWAIERGWLDEMDVLGGCEESELERDNEVEGG